MRPLEPIRVSLRKVPAYCGCCYDYKITIFRKSRKISFNVCPDFAAWFRQKYALRQPRLARIWQALDQDAWMRFAAYKLDGEIRGLMTAIQLNTNDPVEMTAENIRRCLPPDLVEALVAEKLDTM